MEKLKEIYAKIKKIIWIVLAVIVILALLGVFDNSAAKLGETDLLRGNDTKSTLQDNTNTVIIPDSNENK
ncbi:MAG: hypothetical protein PUB28_05545 [Roseburia sp.]|nr:hypothetical protein [Roseburia sp.]